MSDATYEQIGKALGRAEGPEKVSGRALFPADVRVPGLLEGKCLRSPYAHARIISIDVSAAKALPGVHAVLTGADLPDLRVGRALRDFSPLAQGVVRFVGQKVCAVAAEHADIAEEALALIDVEYEELPAVFDMIDALAADAPVLHPQFESYDGRGDGPRRHPNVVAEVSWARGNVEEGFARAARVFEHRFRTQRQHQGYIEPHACVVQIDGAGRVHVWANSKGPYQIRQQIALGIGAEIEQVVIEPAFIGGDFGGKGGFMDTHVAYWLAKASGRPVRVTMNYTEELMAANPRHGAVMTFRTGVDGDGRIVARSADLIFDSGAYGAYRPARGNSYGARCLGPYRMEHARVDSMLVYTNQVPCGSMRSPGDPQSIFASEADIDLVARALGEDPLEYRLRNLVRDGDVSPLGRRWQQPVVGKLLQAAAERAGYTGRIKERPGVRVGIGFSVYERGTGGGNANATVRVDEQGKVRLSIALRDTGSGFYTMLRQVVGEVLGVAYDSIDLVTFTTDEAPPDGGVGGARITNAGGNAALGAATAVKQRLQEFLANRHGWPDEQVAFRGGRVHGGGQSLTLAQVMGEYGRPLEEAFSYVAPATPEETVFTAQAAQVAVDMQSGQVTVERFVTVHDVGTVLNPIAHQGQIDGAVVQGIGYALMEEIQYEQGHVLNAHLGDYKLPTMSDVPVLETVLIRSDSGGPTPFGGKAIGEQAISGPAPAIINAILDATGESFRELPVTAEKVFRRLHNV